MANSNSLLEPWAAHGRMAPNFQPVTRKAQALSHAICPFVFPKGGSVWDFTFLAKLNCSCLEFMRQEIYLGGKLGLKQPHLSKSKHSVYTMSGINAEKTFRCQLWNEKMGSKKRQILRLWWSWKLFLQAGWKVAFTAVEQQQQHAVLSKARHRWDVIAHLSLCPRCDTREGLFLCVFPARTASPKIMVESEACSTSAQSVLSKGLLQFCLLWEVPIPTKGRSCNGDMWSQHVISVIPWVERHHSHTHAPVALTWSLLRLLLFQASMMFSVYLEKSLWSWQESALQCLFQCHPVPC